jgi:hypothetical protein
VLRVRRGPLARPVLTRAVSVFAARSALPADRLGDVAEALELLERSLPGSRMDLEARILEDGASVELRLTDLPAGAARTLLTDVRHGALARLLAAVTDAIGVRASSHSGETLVLTFREG